MFNNFEVLKDHSGKLVSAQPALKSQKLKSGRITMFDVSNEPSGKLVRAQPALKLLKKPYDVTKGSIFDVSKDHSGKLVIAQFLLKESKYRPPGVPEID
jgi:hypothetical protein